MKRVLSWLFVDRRTGQIVVAQWPNASLWIALAALAATHVLPAGRLMTFATLVFAIALAIWALDELARGVNPWRRILGAGTLVTMVGWLFHMR